MKQIELLCVVIIGLMPGCLAEEAIRMAKYSSIEQILNALPCHTEDINKRRQKHLAPYLALVNIADVIAAYSNGAIIEHKHPGQKMGSAFDKEPKYKENDAYFWLVAHVLYWACNVQQPVPAEEQLKFILKQDDLLQSRWIDVVLNVKLDASKKFAMPFLQSDVGTFALCSSFKEYKEWWGEPAKIIDPKGCASWPEQSRSSILQLAALHSNDYDFKATVAKQLSKDPSKLIQRSLAFDIKTGKLPALDSVPEKQKP